jgi:hypothetical protein
MLDLNVMHVIGPELAGILFSTTVSAGLRARVTLLRQNDSLEKNLPPCLELAG